MFFSIAATLQAFDGLDLLQLGTFLKGVVQPHDWLVRLGLLATIALLFTQYALLMVQCAMAYPTLLRERLGGKADAALAVIEEEIKTAAHNASNAQRMESQAQERRDSATALLRRNAAALEALAAEGRARGQSPEGLQVQRESEEKRDEAERMLITLAAEKTRWTAALEDAQSRLAKRATQAPERKWQFRAAECFIDALRLLPPSFFAAASFVHLLLARPS